MQDLETTFRDQADEQKLLQRNKELTAENRQPEFTEIIRYPRTI